jgi:hypothetical protein
MKKHPLLPLIMKKAFFIALAAAPMAMRLSSCAVMKNSPILKTLERLASEAGIPLPEVSPEQARKAAVEKTLYDVLEAAAQWFEKQLVGVGGTVARDYIEKRG